MSTCAGKTQRKFTLLGRPGSGIAAVIVEANRFAYVYKETPPSQAYGSHQASPLLHALESLMGELRAHALWDTYLENSSTRHAR